MERSEVCRRKVRGKEWMGERAQEEYAEQRDGWVNRSVSWKKHSQLTLGKCNWWEG